MAAKSTGYNLPRQREPELVRLARLGNGEAFGELIRRHRSKCLTIAFSYTRNYAEAEDQVQVAAIKAYKYLNQYSGVGGFSAWLGGIVVNECLMSIRIAARVRFVYLDNTSAESRANPVQLADNTPSAESELESLQTRMAVRREIHHMPRLLRDVLILRDIDGLSLEDVANTLRITVSAVKSRLGRARLELFSRISRHRHNTSVSMSNSHQVRKPNDRSQADGQWLQLETGAQSPGDRVKRS